MNLQKQNQAGRYGRKAKRKRKNPVIKVKESELQKQMDDTYESYGIKHIRIKTNFWTWFHYAHKAGNVPDKVYYDFCETFKGMPDNIAFIRISEKYNLSIATELKTEKGKLNVDQKEWQEWIAVQVLRSTEENENAVIEFGKKAKGLS